MGQVQPARVRKTRFQDHGEFVASLVNAPVVAVDRIEDTQQLPLLSPNRQTIFSDRVEEAPANVPWIQASTFRTQVALAATCRPAPQTPRVKVITRRRAA